MLERNIRICPRDNMIILLYRINFLNQRNSSQLHHVITYIISTSLLSPPEHASRRHEIIRGTIEYRVVMWNHAAFNKYFISFWWKVKLTIETYILYFNFALLLWVHLLYTVLWETNGEIYQIENDTSIIL